MLEPGVHLAARLWPCLTGYTFPEGSSGTPAVATHNPRCEHLQWAAGAGIMDRALESLLLGD